MISIEQWRSVIGCFCHRQSKSVHRSPRGIQLCKSSLCLRLALVFALAIVLCGDVETNPGPTMDEQFASLTEFVSERLDVISASITELRTDIIRIQSELTSINKELDSKLSILHSDIDANAEAISAVQSRLDTIDQQLEKQEQDARRDNILLHGIELTTNDNVKNKCTDILNSCLNQSIDTNDVIHAHRLDKEKTNSSRPILIRFRHFTDKLAVLKSRSRLKDKGIGVANDLTRHQRSELQALREKGERGYFKNGQLVIDCKHNQAKDRRFVTGLRHQDNNK